LFDGADGYGESGVESAELEGELTGVEVGVFGAEFADEAGRGVILDDERDFLKEVVDLLRLGVKDALEETVEMIAVVFGEVEIGTVVVGSHWRAVGMCIRR